MCAHADSQDANQDISLQFLYMEHVVGTESVMTVTFNHAFSC